MKKETFKEMIQYGGIGILTTAINYVVYFFMTYFHIHYLISNTAAWIFAVLFAYYANRKYVFHSTNRIASEFASFVSMRFLTLLAESLLLFVCIQFLCMPSSASKILVSIVTVLSNYLICKIKIFSEGVVKHG